MVFGIGSQLCNISCWAIFSCGRSHRMTYRKINLLWTFALIFPHDVPCGCPREKILHKLYIIYFSPLCLVVQEHELWWLALLSSLHFFFYIHWFKWLLSPALRITFTLASYLKLTVLFIWWRMHVVTIEVRSIHMITPNSLFLN